MDKPPFSFYDMLSAMPSSASCTIAFLEPALDPASWAKWESVADEYSVDTISHFSYGDLTYVLPLPQLGCLIEEGPFKAAAVAMEIRGEWHEEYEEPCWILEDFDWEGAKCAAVAVSFEA